MDENGVFMKKRKYILFVVMMVMLVSCGKPYKIKALQATDTITGNIVEVPLSFPRGLKNGNYASTIITKKSLAEIEKMITELDDHLYEYRISANLGDGFIIDVYKEDKYYSRMLLQQKFMPISYNKKENYYCFSGFQVGIADTSSTIIIPIHLVEDNAINTYEDAVSYGSRYKIKGTMQDFINFYKDLISVYPQLKSDELEVYDDYIIVKNHFVSNGSVENRIESIRINFATGMGTISVSFQADGT